MSLARRALKRGLAAVAAFVVGWVVYMIAMMMTVYDGLVSLILQPFLAVLWSGACVLLVLLAGSILRIPFLARWWTGTKLWALLLASASLFVLVFGYAFGVTDVFVHPELGHEIEILHPAAGIAGYLGLLFAVANWPMRARDAGTDRERNADSTGLSTSGGPS